MQLKHLLPLALVLPILGAPATDKSTAVGLAVHAASIDSLTSPNPLAKRGLVDLLLKVLLGGGTKQQKCIDTCMLTDEVCIPFIGLTTLLGINLDICLPRYFSCQLKCGVKDTGIHYDCPQYKGNCNEYDYKKADTNLKEKCKCEKKKGTPVEDLYWKCSEYGGDCSELSGLVEDIPDYCSCQEMIGVSTSKRYYECEAYSGDCTEFKDSPAVFCDCQIKTGTPLDQIDYKCDGYSGNCSEFSGLVEDVPDYCSCQEKIGVPTLGRYYECEAYSGDCTEFADSQPVLCDCQMKNGLPSSKFR